MGALAQLPGWGELNSSLPEDEYEVATRALDGNGMIEEPSLLLVLESVVRLLGLRVRADTIGHARNNM